MIMKTHCALVWRSESVYFFKQTRVRVFPLQPAAIL